MAIRHKIRVANGFKIIENLSAKKAIMLFCQECLGWQPKEVKKCTTKDCPLWPFRTYAKPKDTV